MNPRRLLLIIFCAFATAVAVHLFHHEIRIARGITGSSTASPARVPASVRALRPNYPYSVIPGGAYSPAELRYAIAKDPLVGEHYRDFDLKNARLVTLVDDRYQYASFRLHNRVFWTRNKLRIPKGELLLTDGHNYARTRCGNRLSSAPGPATTAQQPSTRMLSLPAFRPELLSTGELQFAPAPPIGELAQQFPLLPFDMPTLAPYLPASPGSPVPILATIPFFAAAGPPMQGYLPGVPVGGGGYIPAAPGPPTPAIPTSPTFPIVPIPPVIAQVPEPASLCLFTIALAVSLWCLTRMMRPVARSDASPPTAAEKSPQS